MKTIVITVLHDARREKAVIEVSEEFLEDFKTIIELGVRDHNSMVKWVDTEDKV